MSEHPGQPTDTQNLVCRAREIYQPAPWFVPAAVVCLVIGVVAFVIGAIFFPGRAWGALLANFLFWTGLAEASVVVAAVIQIAPATWGRVVQRIGIGLSAFLPFSWLFFILLWFGRHTLFVWVRLPVANPWLDVRSLFLRDGLVLLFVSLVSLWFVYLSIRQDLGTLREEGELRDRGKFAALVTRGWRGGQRERARCQSLIHNLSPAIIILYCLGYSLLAIDLAMTLDPHFHSTMFPGIYIVGEFYLALASTAILVAVWRRAEHFTELISPYHSLNLGNLTWSFAIFWAYVSWSQYIVIWYGNLPLEAAYFAQRYRLMPWTMLAWAGITFTFIIPFLVLFNRPIKRDPLALAGVCLIGALGVLLERFLDVLPSVPPFGGFTHGILEGAITIGFMGAVALPYLWLMRRVPLFAFSDPLFFKAVAVRKIEG